MNWMRVLDAIAGFWQTPSPESTVTLVLLERKPLDELAAKHGGSVEPVGDGRWRYTVARPNEQGVKLIMADVMPIFNAERGE